MKKIHVIAIALAVVMIAASSLEAQTILPKPDPPFKGRCIAKTACRSSTTTTAT